MSYQPMFSPAWKADTGDHHPIEGHDTSLIVCCGVVDDVTNIIISQQTWWPVELLETVANLSLNQR
jgi:hypothetical protein